MTIDLSALTVEELNGVIAQAQQLIKAKRKTSIKQARAKIEQMAADLGVSVAELLASNRDYAMKPCMKNQRQT